MKNRMILVYIITWLVGLLWLIPFLGVFMTAIRPLDELLNGWWSLKPFNIGFKNFLSAWNHPTAALAQGILNSLKVVIPSTILPLVIATMAGYYLSRYRFPGKRILFVIIIITITLPQQMIAVPVYSMLSKMGLIDSYLGLILLHTAWGIPWITFFMRNFFATLPAEIEEAARIDGASDFAVFFKIVFPLTLPAIGSASVLQFNWVWSDFFLALITIYSPDKLLATQRIPLMRGIYHVDWGLLSAAAIMVMIIPILVFFLLQKYYVKGMIGWAMK
ncbi:MAG TPA: carbohydrate ABC transporter permease [Thermotogaceae bacterium]|nr:carbohydrate ABC transporter permease [Thermotogaceae bacterium]